MIVKHLSEVNSIYEHSDLFAVVTARVGNLCADVKIDATNHRSSLLYY